MLVNLTVPENNLKQISALSAIPVTWITPCGFHIVHSPNTCVGFENHTQPLVRNIFIEYWATSPHTLVQTKTPTYASARFSRHTKARTNWYIHQIATLNNFKKFRHVEFWATHENFIPTPGKNYLLRTEMMARGMGQALLKLDKYSVEKLSNIACTAQDGQEIFNKFKDLGIALSEPGTLYPGETELTPYTQLRDHQFGIVEYVPDIAQEFRILTDHKGDIGVVCKRTRRLNNVGFYQATGSDADFGEDISYRLEGLDPPVLSEIMAMIRQLNIPLHSIDLYLTEDGQWGIFEFCCEFGTQGIPSGLVQGWAKKFIESLCDNFDPTPP